MNNYMLMHQNNYQYPVQVQTPVPMPNHQHQQAGAAQPANHILPLTSNANAGYHNTNVVNSQERGNITLPPISSIVGNCVPPQAQQQDVCVQAHVAEPYPQYQSITHNNGMIKGGQQYHYYVPPPRAITPCLSSQGSPSFSHSNLVMVPKLDKQTSYLNANGTVVMDRTPSNYSNSSLVSYNSQNAESPGMTTPMSTPPSAFSSRSASASCMPMPTVFEGRTTDISRTASTSPKTPSLPDSSKSIRKSTEGIKKNKSKSQSPKTKSKVTPTSITVSAIDELSKLRKQCPVCGKVCSRPSTLKTHYLIHTGDTPFKCPWKDCKKAFNVKSNMLRHLKCHERKKQAKAQAA